MAIPDITGTKDLIDEALAQIDVDADDNDYAEWTERGLSFARIVVKEAWDYADWDFRSGLMTVTGAAGDLGVVRAPDRWVGTGEQGNIYVNGAKRPPLRYKEPMYLMQLREQIAQHSNVPELYTIYGHAIGAASPAGSMPFIYVYPIPDIDIDYNLYGQFKRPELAYSNPGGLDSLPSDWYEILLLEVISLFQMKEGDGRSLDQMTPRFAKHLKEQKRQRIPGQNQLERVGQYGLRRFRMH